MSLKLYLIDAGSDEFAALAVIRQYYGLSFREARDLVANIPAELPELAEQFVDELRDALAQTGAKVGDKPEEKMSMEDVLGMITGTFSEGFNSSKPMPLSTSAPKPTPKSAPAVKTAPKSAPAPAAVPDSVGARSVRIVSVEPKAKERAIRILRQALNCSDAQARQLVENTPSIFEIPAGVDADQLAMLDNPFAKIKYEIVGGSAPKAAPKSTTKKTSAPVSAPAPIPTPAPIPVAAPVPARGSGKRYLKLKSRVPGLTAVATKCVMNALGCQLWEAKEYVDKIPCEIELPDNYPNVRLTAIDPKVIEYEVVTK